MRTLISLVTISMLCLLASCGIKAKVQKRLAKHADEQRGDFQNQLDDKDAGEGRPLTWQAANALMLKDNLSLRQSNLQYKHAQRYKARQWKNLIPRLAGYINIGSSLSELTSLTRDDLNAQLVANFTIPNPFLFHAALYSAELQKQNAVWSYELDKRRAFAELYRTFLQTQAIEASRELLQERRDALLTIGSEGMAEALDGIERERIYLENRSRHHRLSINQLLNTPGGNWQLVGDPPTISFEKRLNNIKIGDNFGKLALNLQAAKIEGAWLQMKQVEFRQWPVISFGAGLPPLYRSGGTQDFNSDELQLFSGASKQIDFTDVAGLQDIEDAKTRLEFAQQRQRISVERESVRILQLASSYQSLLKVEKRIKRNLKRVDISLSGVPEVVLKDLSRKAELHKELVEIRHQIGQLDLQFLIWDETFWKS